MVRPALFDDDDAPFLGPTEVARRLGISRHKVYKLCDSGLLRYLEIPAEGGREKTRRFRPSWVNEFLDRQTRGPGGGGE